MQASGLQFYSKRNSAQLLSCEFCEIFKNIFFTEHLTTASELKKQSFGDVLSKDVLKNFATFTEKHLCGNFFFIKIALGSLKLSETATGNVHENNVFFKDSRISQGIYNSPVTKPSYAL